MHSRQDCALKELYLRILNIAGEEAEKLEKLLGVAVLRHKYKKPQGGAEELEAYFG